MNVVSTRLILVSTLTALVCSAIWGCTSDSAGENGASGGSPPAGGTSNTGGASAGQGGAVGGANPGGSGGTGGSSAGAAGTGGTPSGGSAGATGGGGSSGSGGGAGVTGELNLYWVDVEGGAATIIQAPNGKVLLVDTGNPGGRDSGRILDVLQNQVLAERLDHVIITHYHGDHVGGAEEVADGIEVVEFIDHGDSIESGQGTDYPALAAGRRRTVVPGDTVDVGAASLTIVTSAGATIASPLGPDTPNPFCEGAEMRAKTNEENGASVGYLLNFGSFQFLDLGDLTWGNEHELACPVNKVGEVDLLQVPHHGLEISSAPQLLQAVNPLAAVASNGPSKGNAEETYDRLLSAASIQHVWLIHLSEGNDAQHNPPDDRIANLVSGGGDEANFVHARVTADGAFTIENSRNGHSQTYQSR